MTNVRRRTIVALDGARRSPGATSWPPATAPRSPRPATTRPTTTWPVRADQLPAHARRDGFRLVAALGYEDAVRGFGYGYTGQHGQWWSDHVAGAVPRRSPRRGSAGTSSWWRWRPPRLSGPRHRRPGARPAAGRAVARAGVAGDVPGRAAVRAALPLARVATAGDDQRDLGPVGPASARCAGTAARDGPVDARTAAGRARRGDGPALDDVALHRFTGGEPATPGALRSRYAGWQPAGRRTGRQGWLNWVLRRRDTGAVAGTVQATTSAPGGTVADAAWVVATPHRGRATRPRRHGGAGGCARGERPRGAATPTGPRGVERRRPAAGLRRPTRSDGEVCWRSG